MALLLREAIGGTIRRARTDRRRTLRDVSKDARVSLGYLSEIERGRKEPSSELLAAICDALALSLPDLLDDVADSMRPEAPRPARLADRRLVGVDPALRSAVEEAFGRAGPVGRLRRTTSPVGGDRSPLAITDPDVRSEPRWNARPGADTMGQESRSPCSACADDDELGGSRWPTPS